MRSRSKSRLWSESPTTLSYSVPVVNFTKSLRFKHNSIYWPPKNDPPISAVGLKNIWDEEIKAISKKIDDEERLDRLTTKQHDKRFNFVGRSFEEKRHEKRSSLYIKELGSTVSSLKNTVVNRLFEKQPKGPLSPQRDRKGLRSDEMFSKEELLMVVPSEVEHQHRRSLSEFRKRGFSVSRRLDLSRPENFNPGPGSYKIARFLEETQRTRRVPKQDGL